MSKKKTVKKTEKKLNKLFGTDGIRGTANSYPMTPDLVLKVGQAIGLSLHRHPSRRRGEDKRTVLIGKDTRLSGYMLEQALSSGLNSMGVRVILVGPLPTPGIGYLAQNMRADAGIVISASHNQFNDNGIKIFGPDGFKIPADWEEEIEKLVFEEDLTKSLAESTKVGRTRRIEDAAGRYIVYAKSSLPYNLSLDGLRIVLDCANGASYKVAPAIFEELGAEVFVLGNEPNGYNINDKVGALYPQALSEAVLKFRADVGISLDGDADRVIMVDENGDIVHGDHILAVCALHLKKQKRLPKNKIVATQMSNFGLDKLMKANNIEVVRTKVGDKYVVEEMRKSGVVLGGEQSGHIIFLDHSTTGDGCVAALNVLSVMVGEEKKLSELKNVFEDVPQILINTRVSERRDLDELAGFKDLITSVQDKLGDSGRVFVRFSGTEPLVRVLVEGPDKRQITQFAEEIAAFLQRKLG
jgi:phosphoglucosamine mutase